MLISVYKVLMCEAVLLVCALATGSTPRPILRARVSGPGYTLHAKSPKVCAHLCQTQPACDAANFELHTRKCKIFSKCSPTLLVFNSTTHVHFAKRPLIREPGWEYHSESDSCLKLVEVLTDYAGADEICSRQGGRLVTLSDKGINRLATEILKDSGSQYAWVGLTDSRFEGNPLHTDGRRVSETGWFPVDEQSFRKDPRRNCWSLSDSGSWVEHHCKTREQFSICQITPF